MANSGKAPARDGETLSDERRIDELLREFQMACEDAAEFNADSIRASAKHRAILRNELRSELLAVAALRAKIDEPGPCYVMADGECISPFKCVHGDGLSLDEFVRRVTTASVPPEPPTPVDERGYESLEPGGDDTNAFDDDDFSVPPEPPTRCKCGDPACDLWREDIVCPWCRTEMNRIASDPEFEGRPGDMGEGHFGDCPHGDRRASRAPMVERAILCGLGITGIRRLGCGQEIVGDVYRCTDCALPFHRDCAVRHFGAAKTDEPCIGLLENTVAALRAEIAEATVERRAADYLAGVCSLAVHRHKIDARSEIGDALLDYASTRYGDSNPIGGVDATYQKLHAARSASGEDRHG